VFARPAPSPSPSRPRGHSPPVPSRGAVTARLAHRPNGPHRPRHGPRLDRPTGVAVRPTTASATAGRPPATRSEGRSQSRPARRTPPGPNRRVRGPLRTPASPPEAVRPFPPPASRQDVARPPRKPSLDARRHSARSGPADHFCRRLGRLPVRGVRPRPARRPGGRRPVPVGPQRLVGVARPTPSAQISPSGSHTRSVRRPPLARPGARVATPNRAQVRRTSTLAQGAPQGARGGRRVPGPRVARRLIDCGPEGGVPRALPEGGRHRDVVDREFGRRAGRRQIGPVRVRRTCSLTSRSMANGSAGLVSQ